MSSVSSTQAQHSTKPKAAQKPKAKKFDEEIEGFDLFYQLTYMASTSSAGISRARVFDLARSVGAPPAEMFDTIHQLMNNLRYNSHSSCRMVGERVKDQHTRTFLFRLADALRSGEPLAPFLAREASVQGINYSNEYERNLEAMQKWNDAYIAVTISASLIVIINMVSTMIYDLGPAMMAGMTLTAIIIAFVVAWVLSRASPQEVLSVPWAEGSKHQKLALKLTKILGPATLIIAMALMAMSVSCGWVFIIAALFLLPLGIASMKAESAVAKKDGEVSAFFRTLGGTATSRGTTLGNALDEMALDAFPTLSQDIRRLNLRLRAGSKPGICWERFGVETGSLLIQQSADIFYQSTNLGGDAETAGLLCSQFASTVALLRAKRLGVAATFSWLALVMHAVNSALLVFVLEILQKFISLMQGVMVVDSQEEAVRDMSTRMMSFVTPETQFLGQLALFLTIMLALCNAFAIVAGEGSSIIKMSFYLAIMFFMSGIVYLVVPSVLSGIL